jgi:hypothetical protein
MKEDSFLHSTAFFEVPLKRGQLRATALTECALTDGLSEWFKIS